MIHSGGKRAVAASLPVAFVIVGSRWASHIGVGPIYVTDVLLALAFANALLGATVGRSVVRDTDTPSARPTQPMLVLPLAYCVLRLLAGEHFDSVALRPEDRRVGNG